MLMYAMLLPHQEKHANLKPSDVLSLDWQSPALKAVELTPEEKAEREAIRKARHAQWDALEAAKKTNG